MKKEKELIKAIITLKRCAREQGLILNSISLLGFWFSAPTEFAPDKLLGIEIKPFHEEKTPLSKEESEEYIEIVKQQNMDAMFDFAYALGRQRMAEDLMHLKSSEN
jgi:hypothetical protein